MTTILDQIVDRTKTTVAAAKAAHPLTEVQRTAAAMPDPLDFFSALSFGSVVQVIAEVKKASPSAGVIREDFDPVAIARTYAEAGAACISVLTDQPYFQGSLDYLRSIRKAVSVPLLRKDFIIDPYQIFEARAAGADAVLLIAECLSPQTLLELHGLTWDLGMTTLIELYDPANLPAVLATQTRLVGVNNRDLRTFVTDLQHTCRLRKQIPGDRLLVGESGIRCRQDVEVLGAAGAKAILVGETLMRQADIAAGLRDLTGVVYRPS